MVASTPLSEVSPVFSLEEFMANPPEHVEWVDGKLVEKAGMTIKHSVVQGRLTRYWGDYILSSGQGGEVCPEAPCRTLRQGRRPDVAYITIELLEQFGQSAILPQSFPLIAKVASPDDSAEQLFAKAKEYLESGCQEVWLLFPESQLVMINSQQRWLVFNPGEMVSTQIVLPGFSLAVGQLLA